MNNENKITDVSQFEKGKKYFSGIHEFTFSHSDNEAIFFENEGQESYVLTDGKIGFDLYHEMNNTLTPWFKVIES
jgi:hypothetical protein